MKRFYINIHLQGFERDSGREYDHKNVPAVLGIYPGFAVRKVEIPVIPRLRRAVVTNDSCITYKGRHRGNNFWRDFLLNSLSSLISPH